MVALPFQSAAGTKRMEVLAFEAAGEAAGVALAAGAAALLAALELAAALFEGAGAELAAVKSRALGGVAEAVAESVGRRGTARGNDVAQAAQPESHGNFAGQRADGPRRNGIHAALLLVAGVIKPVLLLRKLLTSAT